MFTLYAERAGHRLRVSGGLRSLDEATSLLETQEAYGFWPEGYAAVAYRGLNLLLAEAWSYNDGWEKIE